MDIGLITINTWKCDGDYFRRRQALAAGLHDRHPGPRVILCQECFRTIDEKVDTIGFLSAALKMPAWFVPCRQKHRSLDGIMTDSFSGLGILTNLPVSHQAAIDLPSPPADGGRKAQLLTVEILPGISMLLVNVHLTHLRKSSLTGRTSSAVSIRATISVFVFISLSRIRSHLYIIICLSCFTS